MFQQLSYLLSVLGSSPDHGDSVELFTQIKFLTAIAQTLSMTEFKADLRMNACDVQTNLDFSKMLYSRFLGFNGAGELTCLFALK